MHGEGVSTDKKKSNVFLYDTVDVFSMTNPSVPEQ